MTAAFRLRRDLDAPVAAPKWPDGFACRPFRPEDAGAVHALLRLAYVGGRGVAEFDAWWQALSSDDEYDPGLCFLTCDDNARLVGVALCWTSDFLKDLAVHPDARRRGVGENLLLQVFGVFRIRGAPFVDLKVEAQNAGAIRLYERMRMRRVPFDG